MKFRLEEHSFKRYRQRVPSKASREEIEIIINATCHTWKEVWPEIDPARAGTPARFYMSPKGHVFVTKGDRIATVYSINIAKKKKFSDKNPTLEPMIAPISEVERAIDLMKQIYAYNGSGANAQIVLDDGNLSDQHILWCLDVALKENIHNSTPEQLDIEEQCLELMLELSEHEKNEAYETFWDQKT